MERLTRLTGVQVWHEPLGQLVFDQNRLKATVTRGLDPSAASWSPVELPAFQVLGASIDLPPDAPKRRAWFRLPIPAAPEGQGRLGLLGIRVMAGGPWAVWADGRLVQANLSDWRMQFNTPLRVALPLGAREVYLAIPYAEPQGYAVGSLFLGPMDAVDKAWQERNLLHLELPRFMALLALLLFAASVHLAIARPQDWAFRILAATALAWNITCFQYFFDTTGQDAVSAWLGSVVDSAVTWAIVLALVFAFEFERMALPRLKTALVLYAAISTVLTLPLWNWQQNALLAQHYVNALAFAAGLAALAWRQLRRPRREGVVILLALLAQLAAGVHTLQNLTNQTNPDSFYSFSLGTLTLYLAFMYALSRRTVAALGAAERHEVELRQRLAEQEAHLAEQHARLQKLELERGLSQQHQTIMQDLHDRLGSNLTSALLQARAGALSPSETVLLLQDLTDELRHIGRSTPNDPRAMAQVLAELRQRVQGRLEQGGIALDWAVDPTLPALASPQISQHLRALLSEAIANVIKHARATRIRLEARQEGERVLITLTDNGCGFDPERVEPGRGLPGMHQRAAALGGGLTLEAAAEGGTVWRLWLPAGGTRGG